MFKAKHLNAEQYNEMEIVNKAFESVTKLKYCEKTETKQSHSRYITLRDRLEPVVY
jgi:hypothetical protein